MTIKTKIRISLFIFAVLAVSLVVFLIYPLLKDIEKNSSDIISQKKELLLIESEIENLNNFEKNLQELKFNFEKTDSLFADANLPVDFIRFLEKTSSDSGLSINISPAGTVKEEKEPWPTSNFQLSLIGPFPYFLEFLEKIQSNSYLIKIQSLAVFEVKKEEVKELKPFSSKSIQADLLVKAYAK